MKRFHSIFSILIAILITLSAVVFPAAERSVITERNGLAENKKYTDKDSIGFDTTTPEPSITNDDIIRNDSGLPDSLTSAFSVVSTELTDSTDSHDSVPQESQHVLAPEMPYKPSSTAPEAPEQISPMESDDSSVSADMIESKRISSRNVTELPTIDKYISLQMATDYTDLFGSADERHIYTFTVSERGFIRYSVRHPEFHGFMGWEATLYREYYLNGSDGEIGYMPLNLLKTTALNTVDASPSVGLMPGTYRIVVRTSGGVSSENYTLKASFTAATNHEIECNDTKAAYTELYAGIPMIGSASCYADKQDDDWYLLRVRKNGKARITFTHAASNSVSVAWRVVLYSMDGTELYSENIGMNTEAIDSGEIGVAAGNYFVAVLGRTRSDADYTLTVTTEADEHFERELNDSPAAATPLTMGSMINGCVTSKAGKLDRDYYRFEMPVKGNFSLVFIHPPAALKEDKNGWNIRLLNESGEMLYSMISTWNASSVQMPVMGLETGVYYVEINSEDMYRSTLTYTLVVGGNESSGFETEPNNTIGTANSIAQGVPVTGTIIDAAAPDDDYFAFTVSAYSRVTVVLRHEVLANQRDIFRFSVSDGAGERMPLYSGRELLHNADGSNVYYVNSLGSQQSATGYYELSPGTYYIKVTSGRFVESINYSIEFYIN